MSLEHAPERDKKNRAKLRTPCADDEPTRGLPLLLRVKDAAFALSFSERRIYELIKEGRLELVRIGAATRITRASVLELASNIGELGPRPKGAGGDTSGAKKRKRSAPPVADAQRLAQRLSKAASLNPPKRTPCRPTACGGIGG